MADTAADTARFLMQASLGYNKPLLDKVAAQGIQSWLDEQLSNSHRSDDTFQKKTAEIWADFRAKFLAANGGNEAPLNGVGNMAALPYRYFFRMAWWHRTLKKGTDNSQFESDDKDILRHRIAQALSEILVVSENSPLELDAIAMADYYDIFYRHAFDSYSTILKKVSFHPCMGVYLSHINNRKADIAQNTHPDENYAREIMQLFTIGLYQLNGDGSRKKDANNKDIPSYDNSDIKQMAKVFTGFKASRYQYEWASFTAIPNNQPVVFNDGVNKAHKIIPYVDMVTPMVIDEPYHDDTPKRMLNGYIDLPGNQSGVDEINGVIDKLVSHPNTAPFIARKLIKQLVTSNPSAQFVSDVANAFGPQGNMSAAIRAILLHSEAQQPQKMKPATHRLCQLLKAFNVTNDSNKLWVLAEYEINQLKHHPLAAPTVFNFYDGNFVPHGAIGQSQQVAQEFALHNAATSIAYVNMMYDWFLGDSYPLVCTEISSSNPVIPELVHDVLKQNASNKLKLDITSYVNAMKLATAEPQQDLIISQLSLLLTGSETISTRSKIKDAYSSFLRDPNSNLITDQTALWAVQTILFMIAISPEFTILENRG